MGADDTPAPGVDLTAAVDPVRAAAWREAVLALREREPRRRIFPTAVHVGRPGAGTSRFEVPTGPRSAADLDHALRTEVLTALLDAEWWRHDDGPWAWVTRAGDVGRHDDDAAWVGAALTAYAEASRPSVVAVVTTHGWYDPVSGTGRRWRRLRRRSPVPGR